MKKNKKELAKISAFILGFLVVALTLTFLGKSMSEDKPIEIGYEIGQKLELPDLKTLDGEIFDFATGKDTLVVTFATFCPYCIDGIEELKELSDHKDISVVLVNLNTIEREPEDLERYLENNYVRFPILVDKTGDIIRDLEISGVPHHLLVDGEGVIKKVMPGTLTAQELQKIFR